MILILNDNKLLSTAIAAGIIYTAIILKNGGEQLGMEKHFMSNVFGKALFVAGWLLMGYSIGGLPKLDTKTILAYAGSLGIIGSVFAMKSGVIPKPAAATIFIISWVAVVLSVGMGKERMAQYLALFALVNALGSMLFVLPWQRKNNVVDGPAWGMFALTWVALTFANSLNDA